MAEHNGEYHLLCARSPWSEPVNSPVSKESSMIDYKALLKKYMRHVGLEEGSSFVDQARANDLFSPEELLELEQMDAEILAENAGYLDNEPTDGPR